MQALVKDRNIVVVVKLCTNAAVAGSIGDAVAATASLGRIVLAVDQLTYTFSTPCTVSRYRYTAS